MNTKQKVGKVLGELESKVMEIIWQSPAPISVREVTENLQTRRKIAYTTTMTIMSRLVEKGLLSRRLFGLSYLYQQKLSREKFMAKVVHSIFTTAVSSLGSEVTAYFVKEIQSLSPKKRKELLSILNKK